MELVIHFFEIHVDIKIVIITEKICCCCHYQISVVDYPDGGLHGHKDAYSAIANSMGFDLVASCFERAANGKKPLHAQICFQTILAISRAIDILSPECGTASDYNSFCIT